MERLPIWIVVVLTCSAALAAWTLRGALVTSPPTAVDPQAKVPGFEAPTSAPEPAPTPLSATISYSDEPAPVVPRYSEDGLRACNGVRMAYDAYITQLMSGGDAERQGREARAARTECARYLDQVPAACWEMANAYDEAASSLRSDPFGRVERKRALTHRSKALATGRDCSRAARG